tara:strand:- start:1795 stop:3054 length:1260 start_codon:yes stop_codon:yes gene_type:complete
MIDLIDLKENLELYKKGLSAKGCDVDLADLLKRNSQKNSIQTELDELKSQKNNLSKEIGALTSKGEDTKKLKDESESLNKKIDALQDEFDLLKSDLDSIMLQIPNLPDSDVPIGQDESMNKEINTKIFTQSNKGLDHVEIGEKLGLLDFDLANKLSGSRFVVLKGKLAELQRALIQFMLDEAKNNGYEEMYVPLIVNSDSLIGTGQLPKFEEDQFKVGDGKYLIPTAEVPLTNLLRDEVIADSDLPINLTAHTPCFRAEAGSYGKDTRGMIRQHQFEKIEIVKFTHPNKSDESLDELVAHASQILDKLELSYRHVVLCTGDLGFSAAKTIDIEVWLPSQNCFREISSCSNFRDFQSRRINARVKDGKDKFYPHTLNGSALAVGRTLLAIIENFYENGLGVRIPKVLANYLDFDLIEEQK